MEDTIRKYVRKYHIKFKIEGMKPKEGDSDVKVPMTAADIQEEMKDRFKAKNYVIGDSESHGSVFRQMIEQSFEKQLKFLGNRQAYLTEYSEREGSLVASFSILFVSSVANYAGIRETIDYFVQDFDYIFKKVMSPQAMTFEYDVIEEPSGSTNQNSTQEVTPAAPAPVLQEPAAPEPTQQEPAPILGAEVSKRLEAQLGLFRNLINWIRIGVFILGIVALPLIVILVSQVPFEGADTNQQMEELLDKRIDAIERELNDNTQKLIDDRIERLEIDQAILELQQKNQ